MSTRSRLTTLLSQALVAFTIEFDNEFEHRMPHRTTVGGRAAGGGPWLVSMAMWLNCMRYVGEEWMPVRELERLARTGTNLAGMQRWGYIDLEPAPGESRSKPPMSAMLIRSTARGRRAQEVWRPLDAVIEVRWQQRFGVTAVTALRTSLIALVSRLDPALPDCMPILGYGLITAPPSGTSSEPLGSGDVDLPLASLLARPLVAYAIEFERESDLSLAITADVLRVLDVDGIRMQDLPRRSGVSREAISMALGILEKHHHAVAEADPGTRGRVVRLTDAGRAAQRRLQGLLDAVDERWAARFGPSVVGDVRAALEPLAGERRPHRSPLLDGSMPYPDGWRASRPMPDVLPHFPMVLHRGGFPDGS